MTIYLHIGLNKTGSSSLQAFCHENRPALRSLGLEYPEAGIHDSAHYGLSKRFLGMPGAPQVNQAEGMEDALKAAVAAKRNVLLSSEYLFLAGKDKVAEIRKFLSGFKTSCKVLVYLRRHDQWIASLHNQALKTAPRHNPWHSDIRDYALYMLGTREIETRYPLILDRWAGAFGRENLIVRPFEVSQFAHGDFVWDALSACDAKLPLKLQAEGVKTMRVNESVPEHVLRVVELVRGTELAAESKRAIVSVLMREKSAPTRSPKRAWDARAFALPPYLRKAIVSMFAEDYRYIATQYMGNTDGVLFRDPVV